MGKILLIDDDPMLLEMYVDMLKAEGLEVATANNGESGLNLAKQGGFDVVLLDFHLPDKDAFVILDELKNNTLQTPNKHILLLTNIDHDEATVAKSKTLGVEKILMKSSYTPPEFVAEVKNILSLH